MTINNKNVYTRTGHRYLRPLVVPAALIMLACSTGCKKFLDIPSKDKVPQATLFNNEQGFKDALTGVYLGMDKNTTGGAKNGLYTNDLTMGMVSTMGVDYDNAILTNVLESLLSKVAYYSYSDANVKAEIDGIWGGLYNNIANLNNILLQIDEKKGEFTGDNYNRIKGEAIALRALFHFDLARLFGKSPVTGMNENAIPYVTQYSVSSTSFESLQAVLDHCIGDLTTAKELLAATDTSAVLGATDDPFTAYTQNHLNYWAVQGLLARVYLYKGDLDNAEKYAKAVVGSNKFPLNTSNVASNSNAVRDRTFSRELLFAVYSANTKANNLALFNLSASSAVPLQLSAARKTAVYVNSSGSAADYRYISWFDNSLANVSVPSKFFQDANLPYAWQNIVPLIRVSEMYYIAAECANRKNDITTGVAYLNQVRQARGVNNLNAANISNTDSVSNEIMREYQKEFIQEGQTFYYYKRLNKNLRQVTVTTAQDADLAGAYVLPVPDKEKEYNNP